MLLPGADSQPAGALLAACGGWEGVAWRMCKALVCRLFVSIHLPPSAVAFLCSVCWLCSLMTSSRAVSAKLTYVLDGQCVYDARWCCVYERHRDLLSLGFMLDYNSV